MEESSEMLNPSANSNLRDLILQKLSAAREQKLKQNRSSGNFLNNKNSAAINSNNWEEEKQVLVSLFEKSQNLVNQVSLEKKNLEAANEHLEGKVKILKQKVKELESEVVKVKSKNEKGFADEVKRLETVCGEKDKKAKEDFKRITALEEKLQELTEVLKEKEKELEKLKKAARGSKGFTEKVGQSLLELKLEKEKYDKALDKTLKVPEKELQLMEEVNRQKALLSQVKESKESKEKELRNQIVALTLENKQLKMQKSPIKDMEQAELQKAYGTIASLEKQKEDQKPMQKDFFDFYNQQKSIDDLHFSEIKQKNSEISALHSEISELRHKLTVFESKKYENELISVRVDLHRALAEKSHAKKLLICYIRSVQQLEKMLNDRSANTAEDQPLKLENSRLNEENKGLVEAKAKQEEFYTEEVKKLQNIIDELNRVRAELEVKVDVCQKMRIKENNEELKSWIVRNRQLQELNKKMAESMGNGDSKPASAAKKRAGNIKESVKIH